MATAAEIRNQITRLQSQLATYQKYSETVEAENIELKEKITKLEAEKLALVVQLKQLKGGNVLPLPEHPQQQQQQTQQPQPLLPSSKDAINWESKFLALEQQHAELTSSHEALQAMHNDLVRKQQQLKPTTTIELNNTVPQQQQQLMKELADFKANNATLIEQLNLSNAANKTLRGEVDRLTLQIARDGSSKVILQAGGLTEQPGNTDALRRAQELQEQNKYLMEQWSVSQKLAEEHRLTFIKAQAEITSLRAVVDQLQLQGSSTNRNNADNGQRNPQDDLVKTMRLMTLEEQNKTLIDQLRALRQASEQQQQAFAMTQLQNKSLVQQLECFKQVGGVQGGVGGVHDPLGGGLGGQVNQSELMRRLVKADEHNRKLEEKLRQTQQRLEENGFGAKKMEDETGFSLPTEQLSYLRAKLSHLQEEYETKSCRLRDLQATLESLRQENANLRRAWKDSERMRTELKLSLDKAREEISEMTKLSHTERSRKELDILRRQNELLSAEVDEVKTALKVLRQSSSDQQSSSAEYDMRDSRPLTAPARDVRHRSRRYHSHHGGSRHRMYDTVVGWR